MKEFFGKLIRFLGKAIYLIISLVVIFIAYGLSSNPDVDAWRYNEYE